MCQVHLWKFPCGHEIRSGISWLCPDSIANFPNAESMMLVQECSTIEYIVEEASGNRTCGICHRGLSVAEANNPVGGAATPDPEAAEQRQRLADQRMAEQNQGVQGVQGTQAPNGTAGSTEPQANGGPSTQSAASGREPENQTSSSENEAQAPQQDQPQMNGTSDDNSTS